MLFSSPEFFIFFITYLIIWYLLPFKYNIFIIIFGSLFFYGFWNFNYVLLPVFLTIIGFFGGKWITINGLFNKKIRLLLSIIIILIPLVIFKYANFITGSSYFDFALPLGISFITFTLIAYLVDIYKNDYQPENNFNVLLGYISFFPQLIAGPILRPRELIPQLKKKIEVNNNMRIQGFTIFTIGLGKKLIIADQLSPYVTNAYDNASIIKFHEWLIAFYGFAVQIYCDFSGYTDMAIGTALFFGIVLPINFDRPYSSISFIEFWRRWHITLSSWFRDYMYIPLGGGKKSFLRKLLNIIFTMTICGLWHGAGWNFVLWGFLHGLFVGFAHFINFVSFSFRLPKVFIQIIIFHIVAVLWIPFRSIDINNMYDMFYALSNWRTFELSSISEFFFPIFIILFFFFTHKFDTINNFKKISVKYPIKVLFPFLFFIWLFSIVISAGSSAEFIYFDF